jgi:hypothetical protein
MCDMMIFRDNVAHGPNDQFQSLDTLCRVSEGLTDRKRADSARSASDIE